MNTVKLYSWNEDGKGVSINVNTDCFKSCVDLRGSGWIDAKFSLFKSLFMRFEVSLWDTDLISHDDYIETLKQNPRHLVLLQRDKPNKLSASKIRVEKAYRKLKESGVQVHYISKSTDLEKALYRVEAVLANKRGL